MTTTRFAATLLLALSAIACNEPLEPDASDGQSALTGSTAEMVASGNFTQTGITSVEASNDGDRTILAQTSTGRISGTLSGPFRDSLRVVIHPDGRFTAHFTITCECTVDNQKGTVEMIATDAGIMVSPATGEFAGSAVIIGGTGQLEGLEGVLDIEGTVDIASGLSTYDYSGTIRRRN